MEKHIMTISRNNSLLISIFIFHLIAITIIWFKLDNRSEYATSSDAEVLSKLVLAEIKKFKTATQSIETGPVISAVSAPDSEQLRQVIRDVLEKELAEVLSSSKLQNQNTSNASSDYSTTTQLRVKTEESLSDEQIQHREHAMSQTTTIIDGAIESGNWDPSMNEKIIPYVGALSNEQRIELLEKFHGAINNQSLSLKDGSIPPPL